MTTYVIGYPGADALRKAASDYQQEGYRTVQIGPTEPVTVIRGDNRDDWPTGAAWFVLVATKDTATDWQTKPSGK